MRGFTLVEVLLYCALLGMLLAGSVVSAYALISSSGRADAASLVAAEGDFVLDKIRWSRLSDRKDVFAEVGNAICMNGELLTNPDVRVSEFEDAWADGGSESVRFKAALRTPSGAWVSRYFEDTVYVE
jgi:hypothetical protein